MEHRAHLVPGDERGLTIGSLGAVAHVIDHRKLFALAALLGKGIHPRATTLRGTAEEVAVEESKGLAVLVDHLKDFRVGMITGDVLALLEGQAIDAIGSIEHTIHLHAIDIEVGLHLVVRDVEHLLLHLRRIVEAVVGLKLEVASLGLAGILLYGLGFGVGLGCILLDELLKEVVHIGRVFGHRVLK